MLCMKQTATRALVAPKGQVIVCTDPEELGEVETKTEGGIIKLAGQGKSLLQEPLFAVVEASGVENIKTGDCVYFDRIDAFRFVWEGADFLSIYEENIRGIEKSGS